MSLRATPSTTTKYTPFEILRGEKIRLPTHVIIENF